MSLDLLQASPQAMRQQFGVVMERLCYELRGTSCLQHHEHVLSCCIIASLVTRTVAWCFAGVYGAVVRRWRERGLVAPWGRLHGGSFAAERRMFVHTLIEVIDLLIIVHLASLLMFLDDPD